MKKSVNEFKGSLYNWAYNLSLSDIIFGCAITIFLVSITTLRWNKEYNFNIEIPINNGTEIVYIEKEIKASRDCLNITFSDIDVDINEIKILLESEDKNITPIYYKINPQKDNHIKAVVSSGKIYKIGVCMQSDKEKDINLIISGIYNPG